MVTLIKPLTRDQLASFLPDEEAIRRFEKLYQIAATDSPTDIAILYELVQEAAIDAVTAMTTAIQANDSLIRIADSLELLASNPQTLVPEIPDDLTPAVNVGTLAVQNADNVEVGTLAVTGIQNNSNKIYPGTDAAAAQTASGIYAGTGAPNNANGSDGDFYFRSDGGVLTTIYQRRAGAWTGIV